MHRIVFIIAYVENWPWYFPYSIDQFKMDASKTLSFEAAVESAEAVAYIYNRIFRTCYFINSLTFQSDMIVFPKLDYFSDLLKRYILFCLIPNNNIVLTKFCVSQILSRNRYEFEYL